MNISNKSKFKCVLCNLTFKTQDKLNKHKFRKTHLDNINKIEIEPLVNEKEDNTVTTYDLDPYLNNEDLSKLKNMDIGEGCQITFSNDNVINCEFNFLNNNKKEEKEEKEEDEDEKKEENEDEKKEKEEIKQKQKEEIKQKQKEEIKQKQNIKVKKTSKQIQILTFLNQNQNHPQIYNKWFQILQKVSNENLIGLIKFLIDDLNIKIEIKQKLLTVVKKYKQILVLKKQKGEQTFNNNNITDIISLLVC